MNDTTNNQATNAPATPPITWQTKAKYIGAGLFIGVVMAPVLRKFLGQIQPMIDEALEGLTGQTEVYAERASDLLHKAKDHLRNGHDHHHHDKPRVTPSRSMRRDGAPTDDHAAT
jgi:hypothetical protein